MSKVGDIKYGGSKAGAARTVKAPRFNDAQFVQLELTDEQAKSLKAMPTDAGVILDEIERMIDDGYKFTIKYDSYGDCIGAWCQDANPDGINTGYILTGRRSSVVKSLKQLLFKHHTLLDGDWSQVPARGRVAILDD